MSRPRLLVVLAWLALPGAASAQLRDFDARLDEATRRAVAPVLAAASSDSLPVGALQSKALEGIAKERPPEQIGQVVAELADELRAARALLRSAPADHPVSDREIVAVALATRRGLAPDVVRSLSASRPDGGSLEIPVMVLSELVQKGVPAAEASAVVGHVLRTAVPLQLAAQLPGKVDGALVAGAAPSAALVEALRTLNIPAPPGRRPNE